MYFYAKKGRCFITRIHVTLNGTGTIGGLSFFSPPIFTSTMETDGNVILGEDLTAALRRFLVFFFVPFDFFFNKK